MENKDDLISRRAALDIIANDIVMRKAYNLVEALPRQMTAAEAWEIAKRICCASECDEIFPGELKCIFGTRRYSEAMIKNTPEEAKAKIEAWENRLKVGDVVEFVNGNRAVITSVDPDTEMYTTLFQEGDTAAYPADTFHKTGKTIDIQRVLEQLKE